MMPRTDPKTEPTPVKGKCPNCGFQNDDKSVLLAGVPVPTLQERRTEAIRYLGQIRGDRQDAVRRDAGDSRKAPRAMILQEIQTVSFPTPTGINVNMMPVVFGDRQSVPSLLHDYLPLIEAANFRVGDLAYLTIVESIVLPGQTQRRPGVHTDGTALYCWGGGSWGGGAPAPSPPPPQPAPKPNAGIYMASSDGRCRAWDALAYDVDEHGSLLSAPAGEPEAMKPGVLYWMTDRTPHESLPSLREHHRQFYRLVSCEVGVWWSQHSTPNPLGVRPGCCIETRSKF